MIVYVKGDLLSDDADALVNAVNTVGVMGKGLAFQFKEQFPPNFAAYREACNRKELSVGKVFTVSIEEGTSPRFIINFPTKAHWRGKSKIEYIEEGLDDLIECVKQKGIHSVALPALGSGLGGLPWSQVERLFHEKLTNVKDVEWRVYAPNDAPPANRELKLTIGRAALVYAMNAYLRSSRKKQLTEQETQCLIYLLRTNGLSLNKLDFNEFNDAPFSLVLHDALKKMDGKFLYISGINKPADSTLITLESKVISKAKNVMDKEHRQRNQIAEVINLISGYESKEGMAILSAALWITNSRIDEVKECSRDELVNLTLELVARHKGISLGLIKGAFERLFEEQWLPR